MGNEKSGSPWDKRGIYLRLSKRRKARLLAIAKDLGHEDSPHRALAAYIEDDGSYSTRNYADILEGLDERIDEAIGKRLEVLARAFASLEEKMAASIGEICDALSPLTSLTPANELDAPTLAQWLSHVEIAIDEKAKQGVLILASWRSTKASRDGTISVEFETELMRFDDQTNLGRHPRAARIDNLVPTHPLCAAFQESSKSGLYLACQPMENGNWSAAAFRRNPDGSIGIQSAKFFI